MKTLRLILFGLLFQSGIAFAADNEARFAMKGAGFLPCQTFSKAREDRSNLYYMIGGWDLAFLTEPFAKEDDNAFVPYQTNEIFEVGGHRYGPAMAHRHGGSPGPVDRRPPGWIRPASPEAPARATPADGWPVSVAS